MIDRNILVKIIGWKATIYHGDPTMYNRWRWLKKNLRPGHLRTLDVGSGSGAFSIYATKMGNYTIGINSNEEEIKIAKERAKILGLNNVEFINIDLKSFGKYIKNIGNFDQIICFELIEHLKDDKKIISDLSQVLKPGGKLILTTPFKKHKPLLGERLSKYEDGGHVRWGYTYDELKDIFNNCGLKIISVEYMNGIISQYITNIMWYLTRVSLILGWGFTFFLRIFQLVDYHFTKFINYPFLTIGIVGIK